MIWIKDVNVFDLDGFEYMNLYFFTFFLCITGGAPALMGGHSDADITNMRRVIGKRLQVWPQLNFFLFPFCEKIIDLPGGQINDLLSGKHYSL